MATRIFYTVDQVAEILNESTKTIRRRLKAGDIPHYRFGASVRIGDGDLLSYCESCKVE